MTRMKTLIAAAVVIAPMMASASVYAQTTRLQSFATSFRSASRPPEAWLEQDPAVALYKQARSALNSGNYSKAAGIFGEIIEKYPKSTYTADAYYWKAFSLYRAGDLEEARDALREQQRRYPKAATARDGAALMAQVNAGLVKQGDEGAGRSITKAAGGAAQGCPRDDDDEDIRITALNSVLQMNSEQAIPLLKQVLAKRDACSAALRRKAVFLVSQKRGPEVEDILLSAARNDPDKEVRSQAVFWLSQTGSDKAVDYLEQILKSTTDDEVRDKAIFALSQHRSERANQIMRDFAENAANPGELREKAVFWLGQRRTPDNAAYLKTLYGREKSAELREKILFSLSQQKGNEQWLMDVAMNDNENVEMRKKALFWAGQSRSTAITDLVGLYDKIQNREMKDQLIFVYSQRRETAAIDKMMAIAKNDPDRELRKKAMFWLGQSKDPRVAQFLMDLINQ